MTQHSNPYPGLKPYTQSDWQRFYGRDQDSAILIDKLLTHRLTLLFAASGVGKSSLLNASVIPQIKSAEGENLDVIDSSDWVYRKQQPVIQRLIQHIVQSLKDNQRLADDFNLASLEPEEAGKPRLITVLNFCQLFVQPPIILVLDQFEEFFRYQRQDKAQFQDFIDQLTEVITQPDCLVNIVISMREDFALELNAFKPRLPTVLFENYYRLEKLDKQAAEMAIRQPVEQRGYHYEPALLKQLLDDLLSPELTRKTEQLTRDEAVTSIEPPYLQIVCQQLWALNQDKPKKQISLASYQEAGRAEGLLNNFLDRTLKNFNDSEKKTASAAFDYLVAQRGVKMAYPAEILAGIIKIPVKKLKNVLEKLASRDVYILRRQLRDKETWYELYHDMFSPSIDSWNTAWKKQQQKKQRWVMGSIITTLLIILAFLIDSLLWVYNNNFPVNYLFKEQQFRLMSWGLMKEALPVDDMVEIVVDPEKEFIVGETEKGFIADINRQPNYKENFGIPSIKTTLKNNYYASRYELTYSQYDYYVWQQRKADKPDLRYPTSSVRDTQRGEKALSYVSWDEAIAYGKWLSNKTGDNYRLPTEVEWEYAAKANTTTSYWWGDDYGEKPMANCSNCGDQWGKEGIIAPVGQFSANPFGLYDTAGNVWEWTCSTWDEKLTVKVNRCFDKEKDKTSSRAIRGGSWSSTTDFVRSSARLRNFTEKQVDNVGFRIFRFSRQD